MVTSLEAMRAWWRKLAHGVSQGRVARPLHEGIGGYRVRGEKVPLFLPEECWPMAAVWRKVVPLLLEGPSLEVWRPNWSHPHAPSSRVLSFPECQTPSDLPRRDGADYHLRGEGLEEQMGPKSSACGEEFVSQHLLRECSIHHATYQENG